ncbi:MAG: rRNA maturation RNase YbeY [Deinococcota bacterium]|jgi:probable rRNA maturation factor|nr:rRNA maturation RNase YbeY [Deinococcota bacterium]
MIEVLDETRRYPRPEALAAALERLMAALGAQGELTLVLVDDAGIRRLNLAHRSVDEPTDVLSYPLREPDDVGMPETGFLGDIFVSLDTAARQAPQHGHDLEGEVKVLAAHGLMHLLGHDHETEAAWRDFENAQRLVLEPNP